MYSPDKILQAFEGAVVDPLPFDILDQLLFQSLDMDQPEIDVFAFDPGKDAAKIYTGSMDSGSRHPGFVDIIFRIEWSWLPLC